VSDILVQSVPEIQKVCSDIRLIRSIHEVRSLSSSEKVPDFRCFALVYSLKYFILVT